MNTTLFPQFLHYLDKEDKDEAVGFIINLLEKNELSLEDLYLHLLTPSLTTFVCENEDHEICIWKEHTRTSIVRTILEATYPYVIKRKKLVEKRNKKVVVVCPSEEYHEIGAIIVSLMFALQGYDSLYIGANTPKSDILSAVKALNPDYIAFSVTNYYNLVITKKITEEIKSAYPQVKIIVGGQAFLQAGALNQVHYDYYLNQIENIAEIERESAS